MTFLEAQQFGYVKTEREYNRLIKELLNDYEQAFKEIESRLEKVYLNILQDVKPEDYYITMIRFNRNKKLLEDISKNYKAVSLAAGRKQIAASKLAITNTYYHELFTMNWATPSEIFTLLDPNVVNVSVFGTPEVWDDITKKAIGRIENTFGSLTRYQPQYGSLTSVLVANSTKELKAIKDAITQGLIQGDSFTKISKRLEKAFKTTKSNALRIARTEGHRNQMAGQMAMTNMARSEGVEAQRQIIAVRDTKTRTQSEIVDKEKEGKDGLFQYPGKRVAIPGNSGRREWDIYDRESVINIVDGFEPQLTRGRNPATGKNEIISFNSFEDWKKDVGLKRNKNGMLVPKG